MMAKRFKLLRILSVIALAVIVVRLFYIQIIQHDEWVAKAAEEHIYENTIQATRGEIYMMDGDEPVEVVKNSTVFSVIVDPLLADEEETKKVVEQYAEDQIVASWSDVFADKTRRYYIVAKNVSYTDAKKIEEAELAGVTFEKSTKRVYVEGELGSTVLGFVNADGVGQYGVEGAFNEELSGKDGLLKTVRDVNGVALSIGDENVEVPAEDGQDIVLTIDRNIQTKVEQALAEQIVESNADRASAIVMDPNTGRILAMATLPNYDPADFGNVGSAADYRNDVLEGAYEAASICKLFTFAAAVDLGVMSADTVYYNTGSMTVDDLTFKNAYEGLIGPVDMGTALRYSLNTGSATALQLIGGGEFNELGRERLYKYLTDFGLGNYTGVELFEVPGLVPSPNEYEWAMNFTYANMTFGQGMNVTMVQMAAAVSAIVNGGYYYQPTVIAGEFDENGDFQEAAQKPALRQVISEESSAEMREMMWGVRYMQRYSGIDRDGYYIGGKTGTGQVVLEDGSYSVASEETIGSYVGFGGAEGEMPEYLIVTKIWGDGRYFAGDDDARPIFNKISDYLIDYFKIQPNL